MEGVIEDWIELPFSRRVARITTVCTFFSAGAEGGAEEVDVVIEEVRGLVEGRTPVDVYWPSIETD